MNDRQACGPQEPSVGAASAALGQPPLFVPSGNGRGPEFPPDGFAVILADPPWQYAQRSRALQGTTDWHYGSMPVEDIAALPVADVAARDAVLLLWATWPFLPDAMDVLRAWGFRYVTGLPWVKATSLGRTDAGDVWFKPHYGVGHWFRGCSEPLLLARRGKAAVRTNYVGLLSDNAAHSRKPDSVYELAERLGEPRLELFARQRRLGWTAVGDDVDGGHDIRTVLENLRAKPVRA